MSGSSRIHSAIRKSAAAAVVMFEFMLESGAEAIAHQNDADWARVPTLLNVESRRIHGRVCFRGSRWQGEVECRATAAVAVGPDPSVMRFDDRLTDCQAHAATLWFRSKERIEYLVGLSQGEPGSCVIYSDLDLAVLAQLRLQSKHAARVLHRLDAIQHQVHEHLLKLHSIRHGHRKIVFEIGADRYSMPSGLTSQHPSHFADDLIDRDQLSFGRGLFVQRSQTVDDFRGKGARFDDSFRSFANLRQIGRVALKPSQEALASLVVAEMGCASSCEMEATNSPIVLTRLA